MDANQPGYTKKAYILTFSVCLKKRINFEAGKPK